MLDYLKKDRGLYRLNPIEETWFLPSQPDSGKKLGSLPELSRILLTSDGSMTQMLETIFLAKISINIKKQETVSPSVEVTGFAGLHEGSSALFREGWLTVNSKPLVYAHSLLFFSGDGVLPLSKIRAFDKPLGKIMRSNNLKTLRDSFHIGMVTSADIANELKMDSGSMFWGRLYRLTTDQGLTGVMFELFCPWLLKTYNMGGGGRNQV